MGALVAGTKYRGEFEERLMAVLKKAETAAGKVIFFINGIHLVLGAGMTEGSMDAANLFKPMLPRGQLWCIGATTLEEYCKYVEKNTAFERRFQCSVFVADTINILRGLKEKYKGHHGVGIQDHTLIVSTQLSSRYIMGCHLPDKAINLVDEICANVRVQLDSQPRRSTTSRGREFKSSMRGRRRRTRPAKPGWLRRSRKELGDLRDKLQPLSMKYRKEKENIDEIRKLK
ncbi:LOW QUALITY PROTEIN: hypothetical protein U9M48_026723 [Paspalum notatum var. saurae]|uniref:ClpA/ClpB AAA lid domain-containing protein n=1 Tax=Paspalum notatum var. saurae TaxID=547442 RepID=A0AAQ3TT71_PASNO